MIGGPGPRGPGARSEPGWRPRRPALWIVIAAAGVAFVVAVGAIAVIHERVSSARSDAAYLLPVEHWQERFDADADTLDERSLDALPPRLRVHGNA